MALLHSETAQLLHPEGFLLMQKKLSLEHEGSVFLQYFMNHWPRNMVLHTRRLVLNYCVRTPHISSKRFISQHPTLTLSPVSVPRTGPGSGRFPSQYLSFFLSSLHCFLHWAKQRPAPKQETKVWDVPRSQTWRPALAKGPRGPHLFQLTNSRTAGALYKNASLQAY